MVVPGNEGCHSYLFQGVLLDRKTLYGCLLRIVHISAFNLIWTYEQYLHLLGYVQACVCYVWACMWFLCYYVVNRLISDVHVTMWLTCVACCEDTSAVVAWTQWPGCGFQCWSSSPSLAGSCKCWMWFQGKILMHIWIIHDRDSYDHCSKCMTVGVLCGMAIVSRHFQELVIPLQLKSCQRLSNGWNQRCSRDFLDIGFGAPPLKFHKKLGKMWWIPMMHFCISLPGSVHCASVL
jgi:hypothetical protein